MPAVDPHLTISVFIAIFSECIAFSHRAVVEVIFLNNTMNVRFLCVAVVGHGRPMGVEKDQMISTHKQGQCNTLLGEMTKPTADKLISI